MSAHGHSPERRGYEARDTTARPIVLFGIALLGLIVVALLLMGWLFRYYDVRETRLDVSASPLGPPDQPSGPRLQVNPSGDFAQIRSTELEKLNGYEWVDRDAGIVSIPIERAMDLLAERGLPQWEGSDEQQTQGRQAGRPTAQ